MNKLEKMATVDAQRAAAADMFYGDGAGTRRKLLKAELDPKRDIPGYVEAFTKAYDSLDMNKFAQQAIKERKAIDRAAKAGQNFRALKNGNVNGLTTGVFVVVGGVWLAHQTGYDKKIEAEAKKLYKKARIEVKVQKARMQGRNVEKIFG